MKNSDAKREQILQFIRSEIETKGYPPSVREICHAVNLSSTSTVHMHLRTLENRGLIRRDASKPRALEVLDGTAPRGRSIPVVGRVTAGVPILAQENIEEYMTIPFDVSENDAFILNVTGTSMINDGIIEGDKLVVERQSSAENGDIVIAMIEDEATVKRIYYEEGHVRLQPSNDQMEPIIVETADVIGKVVGLLRYIK
ncbi:MAG TPA: transcriptional repressor LexA [Candidatus Ornithocaccomicrobium faecavium]|mgnify:FL=1|uniref:LexA repressor n=1 Tax=Candidatus Ornithocaccomicrobium faecavium TaxID=2840890 RepID=A0A9D1TC95_9FIRM|nr:transcriptional repressor LexA [Clostridiales bacterium]HIV27714.1 transcriptional repressor LexA [Candidatus Ornithocaccomicrobium faecavium]